MALPFQGDKGVRKWQCFVCGREYNTYDEYRQHITENHHEGRDFVFCPLERCKAPVRDLRSHFNAKHPREPVPKAAQMKAILWRDIRGGKVRVRQPKFIEGHFPSRKVGKDIHYRSGWERQVYDLLEQLEEVVTYDTEKVQIPYFYNGERHIYLPDLFIVFDDQTVEIWEIKPSNQTSLPQNQAKFHAAEAFCKSRGWKFHVMVQKGINKLKKIVRERKMRLDE